MTFHDLLGHYNGIAVIDVACSVLVAYIISKRYQYDMAMTTLSVLTVGEITHILLNIKTPITTKLMKT